MTGGSARFTIGLAPGAPDRNAVHFTAVADGKTCNVNTAVTEGEAIATPAGTFHTVAVEPQMSAGGLFRDEDSRLTIWYSDEAPPPGAHPLGRQDRLHHRHAQTRADGRDQPSAELKIKGLESRLTAG